MHRSFVWQAVLNLAGASLEVPNMDVQVSIVTRSNACCCTLCQCEPPEQTLSCDCVPAIFYAGDSQALPGFISVYLQVTGSSGKWECFASYRLSILNQHDEGKSIVRDSWYACFWLS